MTCRRTVGRSFLLLAALAVLTTAALAQTDEVTETGPVLSLEECIGIALDGSISLAISQAQLESAGQDVKAAVGAFLPSFDLSASYTKQKRTDFDVEQSDMVVYTVESDQGPVLYFPYQIPNNETQDQSAKTTYSDINADLRLNIFRGFSKFANLDSARKSKLAATATEGYQREMVIQNVTEAYFNLLRYERLAEVAEDSRDLAARELERSETYFRLGSAAKSDVLQARVRLEQTRLDVSIQEHLVAQTFANLSYHMNQPLAARFQIDGSALAADDFPIPDPETLYNRAMEQRLDLVSQEFTLDARGSDVTSASAGLWPSVDAYVRYGMSNNESEFRWGAQKADNVTYGAQVSWSGIFGDRLVAVTSRGRAKANQRIAEYNLQQARLDAQVEIRMLSNAMTEARNRVALSRETITQSTEELRLAQERFRVGAGTALDRITAEVNLATARSDEVQAICDYLINSVKFDRALGRVHREG